VLAVAFLFGWRKRRSLLLVALLAVGTAGLSLLNGCGSGGSSSGGGSGGPQPVTTTVTVTASSGTLQQTTTFTLTVN
jgi:ABC-type glycerol-3-phosphate transport system substrate-binding protein